MSKTQRRLHDWAANIVFAIRPAVKNPRKQIPDLVDAKVREIRDHWMHYPSPFLKSRLLHESIRDRKPGYILREQAELYEMLGTEWQTV